MPSRGQTKVTPASTMTPRTIASATGSAPTWGRVKVSRPKERPPLQAAAVAAVPRDPIQRREVQHGHLGVVGGDPADQPELPDGMVDEEAPDQPERPERQGEHQRG